MDLPGACDHDGQADDAVKGMCALEATQPADPHRTGDAHVFINYRRDDSAGHAGRLHDDLIRHFSPEQIFIDVADIPAGVDFVQSIDEAVAR